jgi:hypothetical protein
MDVIPYDIDVVEKKLDDLTEWQSGHRVLLDKPSRSKRMPNIRNKGFDFAVNKWQYLLTGGKLSLLKDCTLRRLCNVNLCISCYQPLSQKLDCVENFTDSDFLHAEYYIKQMTVTSSNGSCLNWKAGSKRNGYALATFAGRTQYAHGFVYEVKTRKSVPKGLVVRHTCAQNRLCVEHLTVGTPSENQQDRIQQGTAMRGEKHPSAKLSDNDVCEIYTSQKSIEELANEYKVKTRTIQGIKAGRKRKFTLNKLHSNKTSHKKQRANLTHDIVRQIRRDAKAGMTQQVNATLHGITERTVREILSGKRYK